MIENLEPVVIPPADEALRDEVRLFLQDQLRCSPPHHRASSWVKYDAKFSRALADRGWVGMTLPQAFGGAGRSAYARFVVSEELLAASAPVAAHWIAERQSGPLILKYGTQQQKLYYIPRICRAEAFFCIGMSEPNSGSDLASVRTRATRTDRGWLLNGQKIWTTHGHRAHYMIALVRTSGRPEDRHQGLSQLIVDLSLPGVTVRPIRYLTGDAHFAEVFFDNVELDTGALIGQEGEGWKQVTAELAYERSGPERIYSSIVLMEPWLKSLRAQTQLSTSQLALTGAIASRLAVLRSLSLAVTSKLEAGDSPVIEAALVKELGNTFEQEMPALLANEANADPDAPHDLELARTLAHVTQVAPSFSLRGGTREVLRGMIARGLGLR
jgi:alkylation response protein AidB-like acyl-CoA dehydrogenase